MMDTRPKVLVADDDAGMRAALALRLSHAGFDVLTASDGHAAIAAVDEQQIDAAVLDVKMPGTDGFGVCQHIRDRDEGGRIPVFLLTGASDGIVRDHLSHLTRTVMASRYLTKPCDGAGVAAMLRESLVSETS